MQKIEIKGLAKIDVTASYEDGELKYGRVELNGEELEEIIVQEIFGQSNDSAGYQKLKKLVSVNITIDPAVDCLRVNGNELPLEE